MKENRISLFRRDKSSGETT